MAITIGLPKNHCERVKPIAGSVGFVHSNVEHAIKNVSPTAASYFVAAIRPGADS
jgi:hypothetical protein